MVLHHAGVLYSLHPCPMYSRGKNLLSFEERWHTGIAKVSERDRVEGRHACFPRYGVSTLWTLGEEMLFGFAARLLERVKWPVHHRGVPEHDPPPNTYALHA